MRRALRLRLTLTHAVVALLGVAVLAVIVAVGAPGRFDDYTAEVRRSRNEALVRALAESYSPPAGWDATAVYTVSRLAASNDVDVAVYEPGGQLLFTVQGITDEAASGGQGEGGDAGDGSEAPPPAQELAAGEYEVRSYPVVVGGEQVATAEVYARTAVRAEAEDRYREALARTVWIAALAAAALAVAAGWIASRVATAPLEELADAAREVAGGDLEVRVAPRADDEVGALAAALNSMADRLARDEQWRRDMTADLSQELRAPLATIRARIEALEGPPVHADGALHDLRDEVARLEALAGALQILNELESEDLRVAPERFDLGELGREALELAEPAYRAKGVSLGGDLAPAAVVADRGQVSEVVHRLLDNALKFTPPGGRVMVTVAPGARGAEPSATLSVTDTGPGIDPVDLPFVFDRFYRSHEARGTQGMGLGLTVARGLAEAQGGTVDVRNGLDGGAVFTVAVPAAV